MTGFKRVFIDTAPIIYFLENSSLYMESMEKFLSRCMRVNVVLTITDLHFGG